MNVTIYIHIFGEEPDPVIPEGGTPTPTPGEDPGEVTEPRNILEEFNTHIRTNNR